MTSSVKNEARKMDQEWSEVQATYSEKLLFGSSGLGGIVGINNSSQVRSTTLKSYSMAKLVLNEFFHEGYELAHRQLERCGSCAQRVTLRGTVMNEAMV